MKIEDVRVEFADNGIVLVFSGQDVNDEWINRKEVWPTIITALDRVEKIYEMRYTGYDIEKNNS